MNQINRIRICVLYGVFHKRCIITAIVNSAGAEACGRIGQIRLTEFLQYFIGPLTNLSISICKFRSHLGKNQLGIYYIMI